MPLLLCSSHMFRLHDTISSTCPTHPPDNYNTTNDRLPYKNNLIRRAKSIFCTNKALYCICFYSRSKFHHKIHKDCHLPLPTFDNKRKAYLCSWFTNLFPLNIPNNTTRHAFLPLLERIQRGICNTENTLFRYDICSFLR